MLKGKIMNVNQNYFAASDEPCVYILNSRVHLLSVSSTVDYIEQWIKNCDNVCRRISVTGFHGLWAAHKNPRLQTILNSAELWVPDGIAPIWVARFRGHRNVDRCPGAEIMREFFHRANQKKYRSYFYGGTDSTLTSLQEALARDYPGHEIAGVFSPPFRPLTPNEDSEIIERINAARPDILWVGLGMPKQDVWIYERLNELNVPVAIGVGAAFSFIAGTVPRCPDWIGRLGFEWAYRFLQEPKKLWRRDLLDGPRFLYAVVRESIRHENRC
jgi:N-acetylglucosaminyldiphosphoundecaprenol N-acetyl-beta-D-mannosaminyltransferase